MLSEKTKFKKKQNTVWSKPRPEKIKLGGPEVRLGQQALQFNAIDFEVYTFLKTVWYVCWAGRILSRKNIIIFETCKIK